MSAMFEIAYAAASGSLCLFTGTGFSKAITNGAAPSWQDLLKSVCSKTDVADELINSLFPSDVENPLSLEESAQVIDIYLKNIGKNIHSEIAAIIKSITLGNEIEDVVGFIQKNSFNVITTNYDKLIESLFIEETHICKTIAPGLPVAKAAADVNIYHVHGSIDSPEDMVVTSDDYFKFINLESYFSRKLSTLLHENTIVILGYSLNDTNLKSIISSYKGFTKKNIVGSNIFFISRVTIHQHLKDYYASSYGIRVIDKLEIKGFFKILNSTISKAKDSVASLISKNTIDKVYKKEKKFKSEYLGKEESFFSILCAFSAKGYSLGSPRAVEILGEIIQEKIQLTAESGAWLQYEHLANWLVYMGSKVEMENTPIQSIFLNAVKASMDTMGKVDNGKYPLGYSWHAYTTWQRGWGDLIYSNRKIIKNFVLSNSPRTEAIELVSRF